MQIIRGVGPEMEQRKQQENSVQSMIQHVRHVNNINPGGFVQEGARGGDMTTLYRERHLCDEVVFDWEVASSTVSQDELITSLECDMIETINQLVTMTDSEERELELKKIEFLKVSIVRAKLGRAMISLAFRVER